MVGSFCIRVKVVIENWWTFLTICPITNIDLLFCTFYETVGSEIAWVLVLVDLEMVGRQDRQSGN